jgi:hypothetical protein
MDIVFITMRLREMQRMDRADRTPTQPSTGEPASLNPSLWLTCYSTFHEVPQRSETSLRKLPRHIMVALERTTVEAAEHAIASTILDDNGASFVELSSRLVEDVVERYLTLQTDIGNSHDIGSNTLLDELTEQIADTNQSHLANPPCVLCPGEGIFLDHSMRFFSYRARGDRTIPLLAIDRRDFHERLRSLGSLRAASIRLCCKSAASRSTTQQT